MGISYSRLTQLLSSDMGAGGGGVDRRGWFCDFRLSIFDCRLGVVFSHVFVRHPQLTTIIDLILFVTNTLYVAGLSIRRCPRVSPPSIGIDYACANYSTRAIHSIVTARLSSRVGNIRSVLCFSSAYAGRKECDYDVAFGANIGSSVTVIGIRGTVGTTRSGLPDRIRHANIGIHGHDDSVLNIFSFVASNSIVASVRLGGCISAAVTSTISHISNISSTSIVNNSICSVQV